MSALFRFGQTFNVTLAPARPCVFEVVLLGGRASPSHRHGFEMQHGAADALDLVRNWFEELDGTMVVEDGSMLIPVLRDKNVRTIVLDSPPNIMNLVEVVFDELAKVVRDKGFELVSVRGHDSAPGVGFWAEYHG